MAYPLATTQRSATVQTFVPLEQALTATRSWGQATLHTYSRTGAIQVWQLPLPPTTGQTWPRGGITTRG